MANLLSRVAHVDPAVGKALGVAAYFDALLSQHATLDSVVRGASTLAECPASLLSKDRSVQIRSSQGRTTRRVDWSRPADVWPVIRFGQDHTLALYLERDADGADPVQDEIAEFILDKAASAVVTVLGRSAGAGADRRQVDLAALTHSLLDPAAQPDLRLLAARQLRIGHGPAVALCLDGTRPAVVASDRVAETLEGLPETQRVGVGGEAAILDLPASWQEARAAYLFTATGAREDPGEKVVFARQLGAALDLAGLRVVSGPANRDAQAVERAASAEPWGMETMYAVATVETLRAAAATLFVHHSTLQSRVDRLSRLLEWNVRSPRGRFRLLLALELRQVRRNRAVLAGEPGP